MTIGEMHYDFKGKFNKLDSNQNRNLRIEEIDWLLNEALELFVKMVAVPRYASQLGFELNQRNTDDIRPLVKPDEAVTVENNIATLPEDYWHYRRGVVSMSKGNCTGVTGRLIIQQHDDMFEESPFNRSSFEWREVNGTFVSGGIKLYVSGFTVDTLYLTYLRKPLYMHYASGMTGGTYTSLSGTPLTGSQNCELPDHTHREIVDIAVLLASGQINSPGYEIALNKLSINNLK